MIGEALKKSGYELYYYKKDTSRLEEDFYVRIALELIPVEVKTTKSLSSLISNNRYKCIEYGIKFVS